jgi:hypothetical protein
MPKQKQRSKLESATARAKLAVRKRPAWVTLRVRHALV